MTIIFAMDIFIITFYLVASALIVISAIGAVIFLGVTLKGWISNEKKKLAKRE